MKVTCSGCSRTYRFGVDALVVPFFSVAGDFGIAVGAGAESTGPDNPDLVAAVEKNWASLDAETQNEQHRTVKRLKALVGKGNPRWWKCNACGEVQNYPPASPSDQEHAPAGRRTKWWQFWK